MNTWIPKQPQYPHFDAPLSKSAIFALVTSPEAVAKNAFLPFLKYEKKWQPFRRRARRHHSNSPLLAGWRPKPDPKLRTIRYASHRDSAIYSFYRHSLAESYERKLQSAGLNDCVIAYRKIVGVSGSGKSNIDFAKETFCHIIDMANCAVIALDVSKFFESIDHAKLRDVWCGLLEISELPPDHSKVFENITRYKDVDRDECYVKLGIAEWVPVGNGRKLKLLEKRTKIKKQLCSFSIFRQLIAKDIARGGLIETNRNPYGIPQGAPLSDLLANAYLLDFDKKVLRYVTERGGIYRRYSDDIIVVFPSNSAEDVDQACEFITSQIKEAGDKINIKKEKTSSYLYYQDGNNLSFHHLQGKGKNGLEYLGFRFDGKAAYIRDYTLSRLHRNIVLAARVAAHAHVARHGGLSADELNRRFDISTFMSKYGRVADFSPRSDVRTWTFHTYVKRANRVFGEFGTPFSGQLSGFREFARSQITIEIARALRSRDKSPP